MRLGLRSWISAVTRKIVSTLAATTCSSTARPAAGARHGAAPIEPAVIDAAGRANPVADRRKIGGARRLVSKAAADLRPPVQVAGDPIQSALLFDHASPLQPGAVLTAHLRFEETVPAKAFA